MKQEFKIVLVESFAESEFTKIDKKFDYINDRLANRITIYEKGSWTIYSLFGVNILKTDDSNIIPSKYIKIDNASKINFVAHYVDEDIDDESISKTLRGSTTLKINDTNSLDLKDIKVVLSERGFLFCNKLYKDKEKFDNTIFLYILSIAYNIKINVFFQQVLQNYDENSYDKLIETKREFFEFNLNCFFYNPIIKRHHQKCSIWNLMSSYYDIKTNHEEIKTQMLDLIDLVENQQKTKQDKDFKKFEMKMIRIGIFIAVLSLVSVIKDVKELFGF